MAIQNDGGGKKGVNTKGSATLARDAAMTSNIMSSNIVVPPDDLTPTFRSDGGGGGGGGYDPYAEARAEQARAKAEADAKEAAAKKAGKDQTAKENAATQAIINSLLGSLKGYEGGRDLQIKNANNALEQILRGILSGYNIALKDYNDTALRNDQDYDTKTAAIVSNRARERTALLQEAASQGAGETDQLRAQLQAFVNAFNNQLEADTNRADTERDINSKIAGLNSQTESQRRSAWQQNQEAITSAWNEYYKNYSDTFTNVQRTGAANNNIDSDYSTAFNADYKGYDPVMEASKYAGKTYESENKV